MRLVGKSGKSLFREQNCLIDMLSKDIENHGNFRCWYHFKIFDGIKLYTSYTKIEDYHSELISKAQCCEDGEYFESIQATDLLKILKRRNKVD